LIMSDRWRTLFWLALAELLVLGLWFSASAVAPILTTLWQLDEGGQAGLTSSVQLGFVIGTLLSALTNLSDIFPARKVFIVCAWLGALANAAVAWFADGLWTALIFRFLTGMFLAGVYPPALKLARTWFPKNFGLALGIIVGALTIGSASPQLLRVVGFTDWRTLILTASVLAIIGGGIVVLLVREGPNTPARAEFKWNYLGEGFRHRGVRLAMFGYFGHMWELYAMWTWLPVFVLESVKLSDANNDTRILAGLSAFAIIASGSIGCVIAGAWADRIGRPVVTIGSLVVSGVCCVLMGFAFGASLWLVVLIGLVWGATIVSDSAQFSASVGELCEPRYIGTMLTIQQSIGFLITIISIRLLPTIVNLVSWRYAFIALAIGPLLGIVAMARLQRHLQQKI
jgi:MFS family permease